MPQTVVVSFKAPEELIERLDELVRVGLFRNRSEALRHALVLLVSKYRGEASVSKVDRRGSPGTVKAAQNDLNDDQ